MKLLVIMDFNRVNSRKETGIYCSIMLLMSRMSRLMMKAKIAIMIKTSTFNITIIVSQITN